MHRFISRRLIIGSCSLAILAGCSSESMFRDPAAIVRDPGRLVGRPRVEKQVVRIVALWEPSTGTGIDGKPCRGFAGQILFFGPKGETGSRVRGKVNISEYDEYDPESDADLTPLHTFAFDADAWEAHRTEGTLGHSYSCFIPYIRKHREQINCGLKVEFIPEDGQSIESQITEVLLTSRSAATVAASRTRGFVRESQIGRILNSQASDTNTEIEPSKPEKLDSLTIPLPR